MKNSKGASKGASNIVFNPFFSKKKNGSRSSRVCCRKESAISMFTLPLINTPFIFVYVSFVFGQAWSSHIRPLERVSHLHPTINNDFSSCFCTFVKWQKYKEDFVLSIGIPNIMPQTNIAGNVLSWDMKSARLLDVLCCVLCLLFFFTLLRLLAHSLRSVFIYFSHIFLLIQFLHFKHSFCHLVVYAFMRFHEKSLWIQLMKTIQTLKNGCSSVTDLSWIYQNFTRALTFALSPFSLLSSLSLFVRLYPCWFGMMLSTKTTTNYSK